MSANDDLLEAFELHSAEKIRAAIVAGADPKKRIRGKRPIELLIEMYTRSARFAGCMRAMLDSGATFDDPLLEAILLDDDAQLSRLLQEAPQALEKRFYLECAYTSHARRFAAARLRGVQQCEVSTRFAGSRSGRERPGAVRS